MEPSNGEGCGARYRLRITIFVVAPRWYVRARLVCAMNLQADGNKVNRNFKGKEGEATGLNGG